MPDVTEADVLKALAVVQDPDLGRDIVSLNFIKEVKICDGKVGVTIELTTPACPVKEDLKKQAEAALQKLPGVTDVNVTMTAQTVGRPAGGLDALKGVKNLVAVGSGKGGVGKSTATAHLALALAALGAKVGVLDADIYGPSIPGMLGVTGSVYADDQGRAIPPEKNGVRVMSVGMMVGDSAPTIWRGPIASRVLTQFLSSVNWGELDYLLMDLPPGTGDIQLTLCQSTPLSGAVIVSTPQEVALRIAQKGLKMFHQLNVPILGIIENMSGDVFGSGGGERIARESGVPFLGRIPLDPKLVEAGDAGKPLTLVNSEGTATESGKAFLEIARKLAAQLSITNLNEQQVKTRPKEVHLVDQEPPKIVWADGTFNTYSARKLRAMCPCANCVNEMTGVRTVKLEDIADNMKVNEARPVGRYGLNLVFSDAHSTGIYTFDYLKSIAN